MKDLVPLLDLSLPVLQAPLPFCPSQFALAVQASNYGALGMIDVCTLVTDTDGQPLLGDSLSDLISDVKLRTNGGVGLVFDMRFAQANDALNLAQFLSVIGNDPVKTVLFRHGLPDAEVLRQLKRVGTVVLATASNVLEAIACDAANVDAIVLQGVEAAGIHSRFANDLRSEALPVQTLLQQSRPLVTKPLILWGDITTSAGVVAALVGGAQAVMVDTPLWSCADSPLPKAYLSKIAHATEVSTCFDDMLLGLPCRYVSVNDDKSNSTATGHNESVYDKNDTITDYVARVLSIRASWHEAVANDTAPIFAGISCASNDLTLGGMLDAWKQDLNAILGQGVSTSDGAPDTIESDAN